MACLPSEPIGGRDSGFSTVSISGLSSHDKWWHLFIELGELLINEIYGGKSVCGEPLLPSDVIELCVCAVEMLQASPGYRLRERRCKRLLQRDLYRERACECLPLLSNNEKSQ